MDATIIQPRMYAIGSDGEYVGTVVAIESSRIQLVDSYAESRVCTVDIEYAHSVTDDKLWLCLTSDEVGSLGQSPKGYSPVGSVVGSGIGHN